MRILIVDDHELVRSGVRSVLAGRRDFQVCGEAVDGQDAIEKAQQLTPDVIVMDVSMPKLNGLDATREIRRILPQTSVLVLSQHDSPEMMRQALNAGARGYVVKSAIAANLVAGIDKLRHGELFFDPGSVKLPDKSGDKNLDVKEILRRSEAFEKALRESEERFRLTFEQAAVGMAHVAPDGRLLRVNRKLAEILGYTPEELQTHTFQELTFPPDLPNDLAHLRQLTARELDQYLIEKRYIRNTGQLVWAKLTVAAVRDQQGEVKYFVSIVEDISAQKDAEARLVASEDRLRALLDFQTAAMSNMAEGLYTLDENGCLTSINPAAEAMFGWSSSEVLGKNMHEVVHHKHIDGTPYPAGDCPCVQVLSGGPVVREQEDFFVRKNGSFMPVVYSASPLRREGKISGVVIGFRDDSAQRLVRSALQQSERQLRETLDALPVAVYTTDAQGRLTHYNPAAVEFSGGEPALGTDGWCANWKFFRQDGSVLPREQCPMHIALRGGEIEDGVEITAERTDGTKRTFKLYPRPIRDGAGGMAGCVNMLVDVTGQKRAQEINSLLAAIVDSSSDAIISKTLDGVITSWNKSAERLFGYSAGEAIGQNMMMLVPPERHREEIGILERIGRGERINHFETVRRRKDGTFIEVSISVSPIKDSAGHVVGASNVSRDITERRRAEKALAETVRQQKALFHLADYLHRATSMEEICESALNAILEALPCDRASVLLADETGRMRFVSWRGLSDAYRNAVDGHSAWQPEDPNPLPVSIENVATADFDAALRATIESEGIRALAFIPLVTEGRLIGKFMTYFNSVHPFPDKEIELSLTIARTLASGIGRKRSEEALQASEAKLQKQANALANLNDSSARLWNIRSLKQGLDEMLGAVIALLGADKGMVQLLDPHTGVLSMVVQRGFDPEIESYFRKVGVDPHSASGRALNLHKAVVLNDIETDAPYESLRHVARAAGYRGVIAAPLLDTDGTPMGMLTTHFVSPHQPSEQDMRRLDLYVRQAADFIRRCRIEEALLKSDERLRAMAENLDAQVRARTAELETRNAEVYEQSERLRDLSVRLLQAQDDERRRIARELHDSVGQILTVLGLNLASLAMRAPTLPSEVAETVEQSEGLLDQLNREIRTMSYLLHPPLLDESGLAEALRWYIGGLGQRSNIDFDLEVPRDFGRLAPDTELVIFRIVQEALTNIHRHSQAEMALIRLARNDDQITVEIQDWGTGIPPEKLKAIQSHGSGVGIRGMRERVRQLHGELSIESNSDGTRVCVTFPASHAASEPPIPEKNLASSGKESN
jgi:PAS domain S-box-containing protein